MKKNFPGYFHQSETEIKKLWNSCIFTVDANILLNLYRYSAKTRDEFLHVLSSVKNRLWLPHRAAEEFFLNRLTVIGQQEKAYDDTIRKIDEIQEHLVNARQHPFVSEPTMKGAQQIFDRLKHELTENQKRHTKRITDDSIQASIAKVFSDRVGEPYDSERLSSIFKEGETRYEEKVPPGFKDADKTDGNGTQLELCRKYGDLLVWFQILDHAQKQSVSMILVTDDKKEDWWQTFKGKTIGPRPELVKEFRSVTKQSFHMYQADRFLEFATKYLEKTIADTTLSEIREMRRRDVEVYQTEQGRREQEMFQVRLSSRKNVYRKRLSLLAKKREDLMLHKQILKDSIPEKFSDSELDEQFVAIFSKTQEIEAQINAAEEELRALDYAETRLLRDMNRRRRIIEPKLEAYADKLRSS